MPLPDGLVAFVKADCPTCRQVAPALAEIRAAGEPLTVYSQDDPEFPAGLEPVDDRDLGVSWSAGLQTVPTLLRVRGGREVARLEGWSRADWRRLTGLAGLGRELPAHRPGCGSRTAEPEVMTMLARRLGSPRLASRAIEIAPLEDEFEAAFERGWTDGLPVVPPTADRVLRMLEGTPRDPSEVVAVVPPDLAPCSVEKVAVNAVLAGCRPEYLPLVLAAVEAVCTDEFNMHGLLATTWFAGPILVVNGPVRGRLQMNSGVNVFGQGNRANATVGRALQLVVRNVGGGRPGGVDRATFGQPGKFTFCFAENEEESPWEPLAAERGVPAGWSAVTAFAGYGVHPVADQVARSPDALARSIARVLAGLGAGGDSILAVSPDHARLFRDAGWSRPDLRAALARELSDPIGELLVVHAGGGAGLFSAVLPGWVPGPGGSRPVTRDLHG